MVEAALTRRVLVVEDNRSAAKLLSMLLRECGYDVSVAPTGEQALEMVQALHPAAVLLDILLPSLDGWEVLRRLKASPDTCDIPVVILSVLDRQQFGFDLGAVEYLVKPVARTQLLRALARCELGYDVARAHATIMVVDEDWDALHDVAHVLYRQGFDVIEALGEAEGHHLAMTGHFDALVLGSFLTQTQCDEVIAALESTKIPVFGLTAEGAPRASNRVRPVFIDPAKPERALLAAIREILHMSV